MYTSSYAKTADMIKHTVLWCKYISKHEKRWWEMALVCAIAGKAASVSSTFGNETADELKSQSNS